MYIGTPPHFHSIRLLLHLIVVLVFFVLSGSPPANAVPAFARKCGSTNADLYRIFMTGLDGIPMPSFADVIQLNDAWNLVHFLRTLQVNRDSKKDDAVRGKIPAYVEKSAALVSQPEARVSRGDKLVDCRKAEFWIATLR